MGARSSTSPDMTQTAISKVTLPVYTGSGPFILVRDAQAFIEFAIRTQEVCVNDGSSQRTSMIFRASQSEAGVVSTRNPFHTTGLRGRKVTCAPSQERSLSLVCMREERDGEVMNIFQSSM